jgi:hypothetical protein
MSHFNFTSCRVAEKGAEFLDVTMTNEREATQTHLLTVECDGKTVFSRENEKYKQEYGGLYPEQGF